MKNIFTLFLSIAFFLSVKAQKDTCISGDCENGFGTYIYSEGSKYEGYWYSQTTWEQGERHGFGVLYFSNGVIYRGNWKHNRRDGYGIMIFPDGSEYRGNWRDNRKHGDGIFIYSTGDKYVGTWENDTKFRGYNYYTTGDSMSIVKVKNKNGYYYAYNRYKVPSIIGCIEGNCSNGEGIFLYGNGEIYKGEWRNGKPHGKGIFYYENGDKYGNFNEMTGEDNRGEFQNGEKHGFGVFYYINGDRYEGEWRSNQRHGKGKLFKQGNLHYDGEWKNGQFNGNGKMYYSDGSVKAGFWKNGEFAKESDKFVNQCISGNCKNGYGIYLTDDNERYEGNWKNSKKHGRGAYQFANGNMYAGNWENDKMNGEGEFHYSDKNEKYNGQFRNNKKHGQGTYFFANGDKYIGGFVKDRIEGKGIYFYAKSDKKYIGSFKNGDKDGWGTLIYENGEKFEGEWSNNKRKNGTLHFANGNIYKGDFNKGSFISGNDDNISGEGTMNYADGRKYIGEWKEGQRNGKGTLVEPNGAYKSGKWTDGRLDNEPEIRILSDIEVQNSEYLLQACINTPDKIRNMGLVINGIEKQSGFKHSDDCPFLLDEKIELREGKNRIEILIETSNVQKKTVEIVTCEKINPPAITWLLPKEKMTETNHSPYKMKALVASDNPVSSIILTLNENEIIDKQTTDLKDFNKSITADLSLVDGKNTISITTENEGGSTTKNIEINYTPQEISNLPDDDKNPPIINWLIPDDIITQTPTYTVLACIESTEKVTETTLKINGQTISDINFAKSFDCDNFIEQNVSLDVGENILHIEAQNQYGITISEKRTVKYYEPPKVSFNQPPKPKMRTVGIPVEATINSCGNTNIELYINENFIDDYTINKISDCKLKLTKHPEWKRGKNVIKLVVSNEVYSLTKQKTVFYSSAPVIDWQVADRIQVSEPEYDFSANIIPNNETEAKVYVNSVLKIDTVCPKTVHFSKKLLLEKGKNEITVVAKNPFDSAQVSKTIVYYPFVIDWECPNSVMLSQLNIKACIKSGSELKTAKIIVNDKQQYDVLNNNNNPNCSNPIEQLITLEQGKNNIEIIAENQNSKINELRTVRYNASGPKIEWDLADRTEVTQADFTIKARIKSYDRLKNTKLIVNGEAIRGKVYLDEEPYFSLENTVSFNEGENSIRIETENDVEKSAIEKTIIYRPAYPEIISFSPNPGTVTDKSSYPIEACIKSGSELKKVQIKVNAKLQVANALQSVTKGSGECTYTIRRNVLLSEGKNSIELLVENNAGTKQSKTEITYKGVPPTITWLNPGEQEIKSRTQTFTLKACINKPQNQIETKVIVNGKIVFENNKLTDENFGFPVENSSGSEFAGCKSVILAGVLLGNKKNSIKIEVHDNNSGQTIVETRTVEYKEKRMALIIGNSDYTLIPDLRNPQNDAKDIAKTLTELGFEVKQHFNLDQMQMMRAIDDFGKAVENYDVALFYYAGHGLQVNGNNYLVPLRANLRSEYDVDEFCVRVSRVLRRIEDANTRTNIIILDACRDNPLPKTRGIIVTPDGLAPIDHLAPQGSFVAYATEPGKKALDGDGDNGLYTEAILQHIATPNLHIEEVFNKIRITVEHISKEKYNYIQIPTSESISLTGKFYFKR